MENPGNDSQVNMRARASRLVGMDVLRCVAMMMVVVLHYLGKGELLGDVTAQEMDAVGTTAWVLEAFAIVAVNVYMLISGYFGVTSHFRLSRLLGLYLQVWMYSVGVGFLAVAAGLVPTEELTTNFYLTLLFPIGMDHYWFMTAYLFLYLMLPLVGNALRRMDRRQLGCAVVLLLLAWCLVKSVLPFRLEKDALGYDCLWYLCLYVTAAYIRRFGIPFLQKKRNCRLLYLGGCAGVLAELYVLRWIYLTWGSFGLILKISLEYNHVFPFLAAVGLFGCFLPQEDGRNVPERAARRQPVAQRVAGFLQKAAPYTLGVYLLHENIGVRYVWQKWLFAEWIWSVPELLLGTAIAVLCVFITGVIIEKIRSEVVDVCGRALRRCGFFDGLAQRVESVDEIFAK